ncbi:TIGR04222 domain-containing membrane protein [Streptomyces sp. CB03234]|uniref:TIGR04222 domain-containing membrane protein n=1 Tax=Streptomyces sp. (strain CB03234) TaxID=1703937 RepID=UPI0013013606|nr:TIGR04222 domain-containing membrane protein [Streptomyces sp. CB03234]
MLQLAALVVVAGALAHHLLVMAAIRRETKRAVQVREDLTAHELAFLAGGPRRVVTIALYRMKRQGRLSVAEDGTVTCHDDASGDTVDAVERAVIQAAGIHRTERLGKLVARAASTRAVQSVGDRLKTESVLVSPSLLRRQYRARRLLRIAAVLPLVLTVGELALGTPHRWWAGLLLSAIGAVPAWLLKPVHARVPDEVRRKLDTLRAERQRPPTSRSSDTLTTLAATPVGAVALYGLAASREPEFTALVTPETWAARQSPFGSGGVSPGLGAAYWCGTTSDWGGTSCAGPAGCGGAGGGGGSACGGGGGGGGGCGGGGP